MRVCLAHFEIQGMCGSSKKQEAVGKAQKRHSWQEKCRESFADNLFLCSNGPPRTCHNSIIFARPRASAAAALRRRRRRAQRERERERETVDMNENHTGSPPLCLYCWLGLSTSHWCSSMVASRGLDSTDRTVDASCSGGGRAVRRTRTARTTEPAEAYR